MALDDFCDGPYLLETNGATVAYWLDHGVTKSKPIERLKDDTISHEVNRVFDPKLLIQDFHTYEKFELSTISPIVAISDIHGHFDSASKLLQAHNVIDDRYNWAFGKGHLVVVGDVFDRGDQVMECLWLIHNLQIQALKAGGNVHFLLGNHDLMILSNDLRFLEDKYWQTAVKLDKGYNQLFSRTSYLGKWLRSCPVMLKINNYLFVHAGISLDLIEYDLSISEINSRFHNQIFQPYKPNKRDIEINELLLSERGPIWYRGFFDGTMDSMLLEKISKYYQVDHIVVGHTRQPSINLRFDGKVIAIDASIQTGSAGEILFASTDRILRGLISGQIEEIS